MIKYHPGLTQEKWNEMSLVQQMANVGSEVSRALNWKKKGNEEQSQKAFYRCLELMDLTKASAKRRSQLKELCRTREVLVDYFYGDNIYGSTEKLWRSYFDHYGYAARSGH